MQTESAQTIASLTDDLKAAKAEIDAAKDAAKARGTELNTVQQRLDAALSKVSTEAARADAAIAAGEIQRRAASEMQAANAKAMVTREKEIMALSAAAEAASKEAKANLKAAKFEAKSQRKAREFVLHKFVLVFMFFP